MMTMLYRKDTSLGSLCIDFVLAREELDTLGYLGSLRDMMEYLLCCDNMLIALINLLPRLLNETGKNYDEVDNLLST
jgi:hypothetical protein